MSVQQIKEEKLFESKKLEYSIVKKTKEEKFNIFKGNSDLEGKTGSYLPENSRKYKLIQDGKE